MKVHFLSLFLLLSLGLAGCGSDTPEQNADRGSSADDGNGSSVVLSPPGKPQETEIPATGGTSSTTSQTQANPAHSPEPPAATEPSPKPVAAAPPKLNPVAPAAQPEPVDATPKRDIFRSAGSGDLDAVKYHLANGIKVNTQDKTGKTPLLWAVRSQKHAVVSHLLARGANPNLADRSNVPPLFWAVRQRRPELVSQLLARGADIAHKDKNGRTALDYAKDKAVIEILRRHTSEKE